MENIKQHFASRGSTPCPPNFNGELRGRGPCRIRLEPSRRRNMAKTCLEIWGRGFKNEARCCLIFSQQGRWNRIMTRRVSKKHNHSIKIKAKVRSRGTRSQQWYPESRVQILRKKCRTQSLFNLHLAGDWHYNSETMPLGAKPHMMRCMLISNLAVDLVQIKNVVRFFFILWRGGCS